MHRFDDLVGQERAKAVLSGILAKKEIPHAFLFTGPDGTGKRTAALIFAMACNCLRREDGRPAHEPCGECRSCKTVVSGRNPCVSMVEPVGGVIKIDRVREIVHRIGFKSPEAGTRVIIIVDAHRMNPEAANALLKSLEEPPPKTIFLLTVENVSDLLPTVVSRCSQVRFNPVPVEQLELFLQERCRLDSKYARTVAVLAGGSVGRALEIAGSPDELARSARMREGLCRELADMPSRPLSGVLAFAEKLYQNRENAARWLSIVSGFLRDAMVLAAGGDRIVNSDLYETLVAVAKRDNVRSLADKIAAVIDAEVAVERNMNPRLSMEIMALRLADRI